MLKTDTGQRVIAPGTLDSGAGQLIIKRYYHLGVAVDTDRGLLVPVLRDVAIV